MNNFTTENYCSQPVVVIGPRKTRSLCTFILSPNPLIPVHFGQSYVSGPSRRNYWWSSKWPASETSAPSGAEIVASQQAVTRTPTSTPDIVPDMMPPPPLQLGDLKELGFCNFTPVGAVQAGLEFVQVTTGLPWWGTIALTTVLARFAILHFVIKTTRSTAKMAPLRPQMDMLMKEARDAKTAGDQLRMQVAILKLNKLRKDNNLGFGASLSGPLAQGIVSISMFIGIKRLCDLPLEHLKFESIGWIPGLTTPDPFYILPALSFAIMNLQIHLTRADMAASGQHMLHFANGFRVLAVVFYPFIAQLPAGLLLHLVLNLAFVSIQSKVLRMPGVRHALDIPPIPAVSPIQYPSMRDTWNALRKWFADQKVEAAQKAQEQMKVPSFPIHPTTSTPPRRSTRQTSRRGKA